MGDTDLFEAAQTALLVIDVQPDFMPGGPLGVAGADAILPGIRRLMASDRFGCVVATQDWHPPDHVSFASNHPDAEPMTTVTCHGHEQFLWPDHCVQGTAGASLHPDLPWNRAHAILRKGTRPDSDSYSGFRNNLDRHNERPSTGLAGYLRDRGITSVVLAGLARDVCVRWTARDAVDAGFDTRLAWDLAKPVDPDGDAAVREELASRGVRIVTAASLAPTP